MTVDLEIPENNVISSWCKVMDILYEETIASLGIALLSFSILLEERKLSLVWVFSLHKITCFIRNWSPSSARGSLMTESLPLATVLLWARGPKDEEELPTQRLCLHLSKEHELPRTHEFPAWLALSPFPQSEQVFPRLGFLKAERVAPVYNPRVHGSGFEVALWGRMRMELGCARVLAYEAPVVYMVYGTV